MQGGNMKNQRKLLFHRHSEILLPLRTTIEEQLHRTLVKWCYEAAHKYVDIIEEEKPEERRPRIALEKSRLWAEGEIKMSEAKKAILDAHKAALELSDVGEAAARAVAHAAATVHVETHAMGFVIYALTALALLNKDSEISCIVISNELTRMQELLKYWERNIDIANRKWNNFLLVDVPNKERLLHIKELALGVCKDDEN